LISKNRLATYAKHAEETHVIIERTTCHDYKVVNIIQISQINYNDVPTSTFELSEQASPIPEGVEEVRINIHLAREIT
jgi:hypothetical protein